MLSARLVDLVCVLCSSFQAGRHPGEPTTDDGVRQTVVHPTEVHDHNWQEEQSIGQLTDQWPDVDQYQRPPLKNEDDDEDHHQLGRVPVPHGAGVDHPRGTRTELDQNDTVGEEDRSKDEDFDVGKDLSVYDTSLGSQVDAAPVIPWVCHWKMQWENR